LKAGCVNGRDNILIVDERRISLSRGSLNRAAKIIRNTDDILLLPEAEQDVEQLDMLFRLLSAGIPFMEDAVTPEPTKMN
jgi:hypothetical protein